MVFTVSSSEKMNIYHALTESALLGKNGGGNQMAYIDFQINK
jgi:hypothetical protein